MIRLLAGGTQNDIMLSTYCDVATCSLHIQPAVTVAAGTDYTTRV